MSIFFVFVLANKSLSFWPIYCFSSFIEERQGKCYKLLSFVEQELLASIRYIWIARHWKTIKFLNKSCCRKSLSENTCEQFFGSFSLLVAKTFACLLFSTLIIQVDVPRRKSKCCNLSQFGPNLCHENQLWLTAKIYSSNGWFSSLSMNVHFQDMTGVGVTPIATYMRQLLLHPTQV